MLDRERIEAILIRRFPTAPAAEVAAATNAIMALAAESAAGKDGAGGRPVARFLSAESAVADDDPLLRSGADHDHGARR
jgi:hypothetical protein